MSTAPGLTGWGRAYLVLGLLASGHEADHASVRTLLNDLTATTIAAPTAITGRTRRGGARCTTAACARPPSSCAP